MHVAGSCDARRMRVLVATVVCCPVLTHRLLQGFVHLARSVMLFSLGLTADAAAAHDDGCPFVRTLSTGNVPSSMTSPAMPSRIAGLESVPARDLETAPSSSETPLKSTMTTHEAVVDTETSSSDGEVSGIGSPPLGSPDAQPTSAGRTPPRSKTSFHLAHPPPSFINRQRLRIRPRLLLQLQRVSAASRPAPAFDVVPSTILPPSLARGLPSSFRGKDRLGADDLVIMTSEGYDSRAPSPSMMAAAAGEENSSQDSSEARRVVATICQRRKDGGARRGMAEICLAHGPIWEATPLTNGGYELVAIDEHGLKTIARWVPRPPPLKRGMTTGSKTSLPSPSRDERRFNFSLINPSSRRHPIIASMTRSSIDVLDAYPTSAPPATPQTPASSAPSQTSFFEPGPSPDANVIQTDDRLRTLILVTGIWVAFREGWSENFHYHDPLAVSGQAAPTPAPAAAIGMSKRSASNPGPSSGRTSTQASPAGSPDPSKRNQHVSRTMSTLLHRPRHSVNVSTSEGKPSPTHRRVRSTGSAVVPPANRDGHAHNHGLSSSPTEELSRHDDLGTSAGVPASRVQNEETQHGFSASAALSTGITSPGGSASPSKARNGGYISQDKSQNEPQSRGSSAKKRWNKVKTLLHLSKHRSKDRS